MSLNSLKSLLNNISELQNLARININTNYQYIKKNYTILRKISSLYQSEIYISFEDFIRCHMECLSLKIKLDVIVNQINNSNIASILYYTDKYEKVLFTIFISTEEDYNVLESNGLFSKSNILININPSAEKEELNKLLNYTIEDVHCHNSSVDNIIQREYINPLYWGTLFIDFDGEIYMNIDKRIGNINRWNEVEFDKLIHIDSLWRMIRKNFSPCDGCSFMNICPPLSILEKITYRHYCIK